MFVSCIENAGLIDNGNHKIHYLCQFKVSLCNLN